MVRGINPITVIGASAGTGKTFRLATEYTNVLNGSHELSPGELIATTFTNKAADELVHRIRKFLLRDGRWQQAQMLLSSPIGTVNAVCGRLVENVAIGAGLSPSVRIVDEERQKDVFNMAVEDVVNSYAIELRPILFRMGRDDDWRDDVSSIVDFARQNNISAESLTSFSELSWTSFTRLLPDPADQHSSFFDVLKNELDLTIANLSKATDDTKMTRNLLDELSEVRRNWDALGALPWNAVSKLAKAKPAKKSDRYVSRLREIARRHSGLPAFHRDVRQLIEGIFRCAADCLLAYKDFKAERGLLDFIDQEQIALAVLQRSQLRAAFDGKYSTLFVDEFQDTSPIQLAVFLELAQLVDRSVWVGDEKQAIFAFRGTDPVLMQNVVREVVPASRGKRDNLCKSYRSRPALVKAVNAIFSSAFSQVGISGKGVEIYETERTEDPRLNDALHIWWLDASSGGAALNALCTQILAVVRNPSAWIVADPADHSLRPVKGSDIAILCRTNEERIAIADALSDVGILSATERSGLLLEPECVLAVAVLRYLADKYDTVAMAEIVRYTDTNDDETFWLHNLLDKGTSDIQQSNALLSLLDSMRDQLLGLTPLEALQLSTTVQPVQEIILKWGDQRQRLMNLEALSGLAVSYEEACAVNRQAASITGLVTFLSKQGVEATQPESRDEHAVQVLTYHKAKGLEWPMVIMYGLDRPPPMTPFGLHPCTSAPEFDPFNPLRERKVRYWPWPYGRQRSDIDLLQAAQASPEMSEVFRHRHAEDLRLLYVGFTRSRDYLMLACRATSRGAEWLKIATDDKGHPVLNLDYTALGPQPIVRDCPDVIAQCTMLSPRDEVSSIRMGSSEARYICPAAPPGAKRRLAYACAPSTLRASPQSASDAIAVDRRITLGSRLVTSAIADMKAVGDALHLFLAIDDPQLRMAERHKQASRIAQEFCVNAILPQQFVEASDRLRWALDDHYPDAVWLPEWPVAGRNGTQRMSGTVDLLLQLSEGYVIVDHKTYPGRMDSWEQRAKSHFPQIDAYARLVHQATGKNVIASYIHMPLLGVLLGFKATSDWTLEETRFVPEEVNWLVL
ncbi:MAG TPA: UvrD-helicase domain-containing protein [Candidatus Obscuribacterales bacterium]